MMKNKGVAIVLMGSLALAPLAGCENLPGDKETQGAVIGGIGGAVAGGALADDTLLGALIGGAVGAGGGWLIGSQLEKSDKEHKDEAVEADQRARNNPVSVDQARDAQTADVNSDGYVTLDEVVAMHRAGLSDQQMINRLEATGQFFELTAQQESYLRDRGVSPRVVTAMRTINEDVKREAYARYGNDNVRQPND